MGLIVATRGAGYGDTFYKLSDFSTTVESSFSSSGNGGNYATSIAWTGTTLYVGFYPIYAGEGRRLVTGWGNPGTGIHTQYYYFWQQAYDKVHAIWYHYASLYPAYTTVNKNISTVLPHYSAEIAHDGTDLLAAYQTTVYKYVGITNTIQTQFTHPHGNVSGLAWDGNDLYTAVDNTVYRHAGFSDSIKDSINVLDFDSASLGYPFVKLEWDGSPAISLDKFTVSLQYKNASSILAPVTTSLGDIGSSIGIGAHTCYWGNPSQDRAGVEISDEVMRVIAAPAPENQESHTLSIVSASQLSTGDGTGSQGDVKVEYEIT